MEHQYLQAYLATNTVRAYLAYNGGVDSLPGLFSY